MDPGHAGKFRTRPWKKSLNRNGSRLCPGGLVPTIMLCMLVLAAGAAMLQLWLQFDLSSSMVKPQSNSTLDFLDAPLLKELPEFSGTYQDEMLWGTYRSGHYFGVRTRQARPMTAGLIWFNPDDVSSLLQRQVRHEARQEDGLTTYGWLAHDGRTFGVQRLVDGPLNITLGWVKSRGPGCGPGGDWALQVRVSQTQMSERASQQGRRVALVVYLVDENDPGQSWVPLPNSTERVEDVSAGAALLAGRSRSLGDWGLYLRTSNKAPLHYVMKKVSEDALTHTITELLLKQLRVNAQATGAYRDLHIGNALDSSPNTAMFQVSMGVPGTLELAFLTNPADGADRLAKLTGDRLSEDLASRTARFLHRLDTQFLRGQGAEQLSSAAREVVAAAVSNLLGGIGYFHGYSLVSMAGEEPEVQPYGPCSLLTCVPSRSFFPRGFLWDEGYHQLLLQHLDSRLSRDILAHWLDLLNAQGWIPREQILGAEARARVPPEFIVQHPSHGNPPSLFLALSHMAHSLHESPANSTRQEEQERDEEERRLMLDEVAANREFLQAAWPRLVAWLGWYLRTQRGPRPYSYRWHGRNASTNMELNPKTLMSGLDDYPRASHPSEGEMHLDLRCWVLMASQAMSLIGKALKLPRRSVAPYEKLARKLGDLKLLRQMHLDGESGMYLDFGNHTEEVHMERTEQGSMVRVVDSPPTPQLVPSFGYVALFPLFMHLIPASSHELAKQLDLLSDPRLLYSPHGLRSLATTSRQYRQYNTATDPPYWRGAVWVNINFMALQALHHYCHAQGPFQERACRVQQDLRARVLRTVVQQYSRTGYLWEQYDDSTGAGKGCRPFTGWTALVALIAADRY